MHRTPRRALADLAIESPYPSVRQAAIERLKGRPLRDFAGRLVEMIHAPVSYDFVPVRGPGSTGGLEIDTPRLHMLRTYEAPPVVTLASTFRGYVGYDAYGMPFIASGLEIGRLERREVRQDGGHPGDRSSDGRARGRGQPQGRDRAAAAHRRRQCDRDVQCPGGLPQGANPACPPGAADAPDLVADDEDAWHKWWYDRIGYRYDPPPKVTIVQSAVAQLPPPTISTCFAAGTPVRTLEGPRPIEAIRVGDRVLSQDPTTGRLDFQPVLVVHHNPPGETLRIVLEGGETIVSSVYHRFWRTGRGWAMAHELKPGETIRSLGSLVRVASIETGIDQPLYNLDVAGTRTFFVGRAGALVHDNTLPDLRINPFDATPGEAGTPAGEANRDASK